MTIRIVVLGATNTGKSTLCNVICNQENAFETRSSKQGMKLSRDKNKSVSFVFNQQQFEIIDSVGFIQTNLPDTIHEIKQLQNDLQGCTYDTISVYLLVIPYERLSDSKHIDTIQFVLKYFPPNSLDYMMIVFTKCQGKQCNEIVAELRNEQSIKQLFESLLDKIKEDRIITTECKNGDILQQRKNILKSICKHVKKNGIEHKDVRAIAINKLHKDIEKKLRIKILKKKYTVPIFAVVVICICIIYYKTKIKAETANATINLVTKTETIASKLKVANEDLSKFLTKIGKKKNEIYTSIPFLTNLTSMKNDLYHLTQEIKNKTKIIEMMQNQLSALENTISTLPIQLTEVTKEIQMLQNKLDGISKKSRMLYYFCYIIIAIGIMMYCYIMYTISGNWMSKNKQSKLFTEINLRRTLLIHAAMNAFVIVIVAFNHYKHY